MSEADWSAPTIARREGTLTHHSNHPGHILLAGERKARRGLVVQDVRLGEAAVGVGPLGCKKVNVR